MLQIMREKLAGFVTWFFVIVLVLVFALFGLGYYFNASHIGAETVAEVNGQPITDRQLQLAIDNLRRRQALGVLSAKQQVALKKIALQALVQQSLLTQSANRIGLGVSQQEIDALLYRLPAFQQDGHFSQSIIGSEFALPNEIRYFAAMQAETRAVRYIAINHSLFRQKVVIKPQQVQQYYQQHSQAFYSKTAVQLAYVVLSLKKLESKITVSIAEAKQYYQQHRSNFAKQTFAQAKPKIIRSIKLQRAQQQYGSLGEKLSNLAFENPDSLSFVSKQLGLPVHTTDWITKKGTKSGMMANKKVIDAAFSDDVLKQGNNSAIINLSDNQAIVLRVHRLRVAKRKPLSEVKPIIIAKLTALQEAGYAEHYAQTLAMKVNQNQHVNTLLSHYHLTWHTLTKLSRNSDRLPASIISGIFSQPAPQEGQFGTAVALSEPNLPKTYLIQVKHIDLGKTVLSQAQKSTYSLVLSRAWADALYQSYVNLLKSEAKIHYATDKHE